MATDGGASPMSICADGSVGTSDVFILLAIVAVLTALGWVVWNWTKRRFL